MTASSPPLLLPRAPAVLFLYGLSAAGKSYVGDLIARAAGFPVYHADEDLTDEMKSALREARPFTDPMRDRYFAIVAARIAERRAGARCLVVTQGLYRRRHRAWLRERIPGLDLVCVTAPTQTIIERLSRRRNGISVASAAAIAKDFDVPDVGAKILSNDGDDAGLLRQLVAFYG